MARQGNCSGRCYAPVSAKTCYPRFFPPRLLDLHIIRKCNRSIRAMKYIPTCTSFVFLVRLSWTLFILWRRPTSENSSSAALSFRPSRLVLSAMYRFQSGLLDSSSLIRVTQRWIRRSHRSGPAPSLLMILTDCAISKTRSFTLLSIRCVVKPPLSCQIPVGSAAHWLAPTPAFSAQMRTWRVGLLIVFASTLTDFGNQQASHHI